MKRQIFFNLLFTFFYCCLHGQSPYILDLKKEKKEITPVLFFIEGVKDERINKADAGFLLNNGKKIKVIFKTSLASDLNHFINGCLIQDTSKTPLIISFDKFSLSETGTTANHKVTFDFAVSFYRYSGEKRIKLFDIQGTPSLDIRGSYPNAQEKLIQESVYNAIENFNNWVNENSNQPLLGKNVVVSFKTNDKKSTIKNDTIRWKENYKLNWSDFKGKPSSSPFMAQSNCIFLYASETNLKDGMLQLLIDLNACFDRARSWVKDEQQKDALLAHEQLHFDICELNIRKLKKKLLSENFDIIDFSNRVNILFDEAWKEYQQQQQLYDEETKHGIVEDEQKKWSEFITSELKSLPE
jgi:hypothetical protein